jgi:hypothetical protein
VVFKKLLQWVILVIFISANIGGIYFASLQKYPPLIPSQLSFISFNLINLPKNFETANFELVAESILSNGSSKRIDLKQFFPSLRGKESIRNAISATGSQKEELLTKTARILFERENASGEDPQSVQLLWERWPKSKNGFRTLYAPPDLSISTPIAKFPE